VTRIASNPQCPLVKHGITRRRSRGRVARSRPCPSCSGAFRAAPSGRPTGAMRARHARPRRRSAPGAEARGRPPLARQAGPIALIPLEFDRGVGASATPDRPCACGRRSGGLLARPSLRQVCRLPPRALVRRAPRSLRATAGHRSRRAGGTADDHLGANRRTRDERGLGAALQRQARAAPPAMSRSRSAIGAEATGPAPRRRGRAGDRTRAGCACASGATSASPRPARHRR